MFIAFFRILGLSLSLGIYHIFLVLLRRSSHPASGSFFREDEKKNSRSTASGLDHRCTMFQFLSFLSFPFISIWYIFLVRLRLFFREGRGTASGLDERCTIFDVFIICIQIPSFNWFFFGQPETNTKSPLNMNVNIFLGFFIDILQDFFSIPAARFYHSWVESPV